MPCPVPDTLDSNHLRRKGSSTCTHIAFGSFLNVVHIAMTSAIDTALNKFLQARSMDAQSRQSPAHPGVHARNLTPAEGHDQPETGPSGMAENMQHEEKPDVLDAQPSSAPVDRMCDLTNPLDSGEHGERSAW